jgi:hypothetical protein
MSQQVVARFRARPLACHLRLFQSRLGKLLSVLCLLLKRDEFLILAHISPLSRGLY